MKKLLIVLVTLCFVPLVSAADDGLMVDFSAPAEVLADGNRIAVSGQPSEQDLDALVDAGYTAVIDLRGESEARGYEEQAAVESRGMRYISLPVAGASDVNFAAARELDAILEDVDGPVLLHCASGNRVGALLALREGLHGANREQALEFGDRAGLASLRPLVEKTLKEAGAEPASNAESEQ